MHEASPIQFCDGRDSHTNGLGVGQAVQYGSSTPGRELSHGVAGEGKRKANKQADVPLTKKAETRLLRMAEEAVIKWCPLGMVC